MSGQANRRQLLNRAAGTVRGPLLQYARALLKDDSLAHDVVQDAFLRLWDNRSVVTDVHARRWLYTTTRRLCLDRLKVDSRRREILTGLAAVSSSHAADQRSTAEARELLEAFLEALSELPTRQQEVVRLRLHSELSYREIAAMIGTTPGHVGVMLHEAMKRLRAVVLGEPVRVVRKRSGQK